MSLTLSGYIARQFLVWFGVFLGGLSLIVLVANLLELLRRASSRPEIGFGPLFRMALLQMPHTTEVLLPFAILFSGIMAFWRLTRSNELVVARAVGVSVWQFMAPAVAVALVIAALKLAFFNSVSALAFAEYEQMEAKLMQGRVDQFAVSDSGLFLRQLTPSGPAVIHSKTVSSDLKTLATVTILLYDQNDRFAARIDAPTAILRPGAWHVEQANLAPAGQPSRPVGAYDLPTDLTVERIQDSFARPETMAFWSLPGFIRVLEHAGFSAVRPRLYFQSQLAAPVLLSAMVLLAATFSLRPARRGGVGRMIGSGVAAGFVFYFGSDIAYALGLSNRLPVALAAWAPAVVTLSLGAAMLLHLEDG